jgi:hypothetical protein
MSNETFRAWDDDRKKMSTETFRAWDDDRKQVRFNYWNALRKVAKEYYAIVGRPDPDGLGPYLLEQYGLKMNLTSGSMITGEYDIVDEKKYLVFILKFM